MIPSALPPRAPTIGARAALTALMTLLACGPARSSSPPPASGTPVTTTPAATSTPSASPFDLARPFLGLDRATLLQRLGGAAADVKPTEYGPSKGLELVYVPASSPARFYLADGKVILAYFSGAPVESVAPETLAATHPGAAELPSRAGKLYTHHVDAAAGVAWSDDGDEIAFVEVFAPTDLAGWTARFYVPPRPFYK